MIALNQEGGIRSLGRARNRRCCREGFRVVTPRAANRRVPTMSELSPRVPHTRETCRDHVGRDGQRRSGHKHCRCLSSLSDNKADVARASFTSVESGSGRRSPRSPRRCSCLEGTSRPRVIDCSQASSRAQRIARDRVV